MNREISFRAWYDGQMFYDNSKFENFHITLDGKKLFSQDCPDGEFDDTFSDDIILMQFTGLKDKNGKEIYEFDIIEKESEEGEKYKMLVVWHEAGFKLVPRNIPEGQWALPEDMPPSFGLFEGQMRSQCEVLGNPFETPDLLPKQDD